MQGYCYSLDVVCPPKFHVLGVCSPVQQYCEGTTFKRWSPIESKVVELHFDECINAGLVERVESHRSLFSRKQIVLEHCHPWPFCTQLVPFLLLCHVVTHQVSWVSPALQCHAYWTLQPPESHEPNKCLYSASYAASGIL